MLNITNESRVFQGPWTSLVKGRGLGSNTKKFSNNESLCIKEIIKNIDKTSVKNNAYHVFSKELSHFILDFNNPDVLFFQRKELHARIDHVIRALKVIEDPFSYISASAIFFEVIGKLSLDPNMWTNKCVYLVDDALAQLQYLPISSEQDCYKALQVYGNLFLGIAHIGQIDKLTKGRIDYIKQALNVIDGLKDVWHRGRGVAAFLTILGVIGLADYGTGVENNYLKELIVFIDVSLRDQVKVDERPNEYVFSILLMVNCISVFDKLEYLEYKRDWIKLAAGLIEKLPIDLKAIFSHYYLSTLDNLGLFDQSSKKYFLDMLDNLFLSEGGELSYMAYTYCVDIAHKLDLVEMLPSSFVDHFIDNISTQYDFPSGNIPDDLFYRSGFMRLAYALTAMSQMGCVECLLDINTSDGKSLVESIINNHLKNWENSDDSFMTLNHSLIDLSLSQRGENVSPSEIDKNVVLHRNDISVPTSWAMDNPKKVALHAYFPGMNSRRYYSNLPRDLYDNGNKKVRAIFEDSYKVLNREKSNNKTPDLSMFFFENTILHDDVSEKWNCIGSSMTVYNLALLEHMKTSNEDFHINSFGGESYGMIAAAIASGALSLEDGLKIADNVLGLIYKSVHLNDFGLWHIVSFSGRSIHSQLKVLRHKFTEGVDIFRWQTLSDEKQDVHLYIKDDIFEKVKQYVSDNFEEDISLEEFKQPTIEIVHSPKLISARIDIANFIIDENISFLTPNVPIVANNGTGIASSKHDVRNLILDMANIPMFSAQSFQSITNLIPHDTLAIVEFGYGQKTRNFIVEHNVEQHFFEYFGGVNKLKEIDNMIMNIKLVTKTKDSKERIWSKKKDETELASA